MEIYLEIYRNIVGVEDSQLISNIKALAFNLMKNNINNIMYLTNSASHFAYLCFTQALNQLSMMNSLISKKMQKSIFTFNYQFANIL